MLRWWCCFCSAHFRSENQENSLGNKHLRAMGCDSRWFHLSHMAKHIWQFNIFVHLLSLSFSIHSFQKHLFKTFIQISIPPNLNHLIHYIPQKNQRLQGPSKNCLEVAAEKNMCRFGTSCRPRRARLMRMLRLAKLGAIWERIEARIGSIFFVQCVALIRGIAVNGYGGTDGATRKTSREHHQLVVETPIIYKGWWYRIGK